MKNTLRIFFIVIIAPILASCGNKIQNGNEPTGNTDNPNKPTFSDTYSGDIVIDLKSGPEISLNASSITEIILQFIPRTTESLPLSPKQVEVSMLIDDKKVDLESIISSSSEQLAFNVNFELVLDASYSMVVSHESEAFTPMLESAKNSVQKGIDIWAEQEGRFSFHTTWFNNDILSSLNTLDRQWTANDITDIPLPRSGDFTRLFAAADFAIENMNTPGNDLGQRDQNILLIFSDGEDNLSNVNDNGDLPTSTFTTVNGAEYTKHGRNLTTLDDLLETIDEQENLSVHVIGMGSEINVDDLQSIANAGNGLYLQNPDASDIEKPFQRVIQEFTTVQTHGIKIPKPAGEYKFTLRVKNVINQNAAEYSFQFRTGNGSAEIIDAQ